MFKDIREELLANEKFNSLVVLISHLTDKVIELNDTVHEITAILSRENTKDNGSTNCPITHEDFD